MHTFLIQRDMLRRYLMMLPERKVRIFYSPHPGVRVAHTAVVGPARFRSLNSIDAQIAYLVFQESTL